MKTFTVTRRPGCGLAQYSPEVIFPSYRIVAASAKDAKKIACRLDKQDERFFNLYIAFPVTKKRRSAATDRRFAKLQRSIAIMKTKDRIPQLGKLIKGGRWI